LTMNSMELGLNGEAGDTSAIVSPALSAAGFIRYEVCPLEC